MITIYSDDHRLHHGAGELIDGRMVPPFEKPERADVILERVLAVALGDVREPDVVDLDAIERVHSPQYVEFLRSAHALWREEHGDSDALPVCWPNRTLRQVVPDTIDGQLSYYSFDAATPITAGTWQAATSAAAVAVTGARLLDSGEDQVFSLCRPPGHHSASDLYGGYCFFNNAAIAAQNLLDSGRSRVAILDIDYHHGNGTQAIFYRRPDVFFVSLHGDPRQEFPYFLGYSDEQGEGAGAGFNLNFPLPWGTDWPTWALALDAGLERIRRYAPEALVVSLGTDTFEKDPISRFRLKTENYAEIGHRIAALGVPVLFVMEGGYAVAEIGVNAVNVLTGAQAG